MVTDNDFETFVRSYMVTALFASLDENHGKIEGRGEHLDDTFDVEDIAPETQAWMREDCRKFVEKYGHLLTYDNMNDQSEPPFVHAGSDLWYTRNGHGVGFWDGDWKEPAATVMYDACDWHDGEFQECSLYADEDNIVRHE